jgi:hypothetical protein
MNKIKYYAFLFSILITTSLIAQELTQDQLKRRGKDYIEYIPGNMPLIISIPHDGNLKPNDIPPRPCKNCAKNRDVYTIEIGLEIRKIIFREIGLYPYIIINNLHRTRLDPNRNINEAADGDSIAGKAWEEFQSYIDSAESAVQNKFGKGLYIDLHGHRHPIKQTEIGYLLSSDELRLDDSFLNSGSFSEYSSIRHLIGYNSKALSFTELIKGQFSLGTLLEAKGYPCVPSSSKPFPAEGEAYFSGGYNTTRHGSSQGSTIDGIQIELDIDLRSDSQKRLRLANDLALVLVDYLKIHYFPDLKP